MGRNPPEEEAGRGHPAPDAPSLRWEVRPAPRGEGVSAAVAALLTVPDEVEVASRPVLEQLTAAVHLAEAAAMLELWPLTEDELGSPCGCWPA